MDVYTRTVTLSWKGGNLWQWVQNSWVIKSATVHSIIFALTTREITMQDTGYTVYYIHRPDKIHGILRPVNQF